MVVFYVAFATFIIFFVFKYLDKVYRQCPVSDLEMRRILVTGTDSGFGRHVALDLSRRGMIVYAGCYTENGVKSLQNESDRLGVHRDNLKLFTLDVSNDSSVAKAKQFIENDLPKGQGLWALVNNAGIVGGVLLDWTTVDQYHDVMNVNFYGQVRMTIAFLPLIKVDGGGRLINVASIMGRVSLNGSPYVCSKFAIEAYSDGLRRQVAKNGVNVSIIEPGSFKTNLSDHQTIMDGLDRQWKNLPDERQLQLGGDSHKQAVKETVCTFFNEYPLASGNRIEEVTESIRHAITSNRPKARYVCGLDAKVLYRPLATLTPDWMADLILNFFYG